MEIMKCFYRKEARHIQSKSRKTEDDEKNGVVNPSTLGQKESINNTQVELEL